MAEGWLLTISVHLLYSKGRRTSQHPPQCVQQYSLPQLLIEERSRRKVRANL